ncbi:MAG: Crp/Fnr family transcriptional regulator [Clostridia bacterium]|nr:Crp/Fnr family transcriptional regulator [Clostridia bacterium]
MQFSDKDRNLGLVDSGTAYLIRIDIDGNRSIIDYYESGDVFGKMLAPESEIDAYYILAKEKCRISFFNYDKLLSKCKNNCIKHTVLLNNLLMLTLKKAQMHIDILSQRTTRQKLITYFDYQRNKNLSDTFTLPLSLSDLSDYLSIDRSAMMREIRNLKEDNLISADGNRFTLKNSRYTYADC